MSKNARASSFVAALCFMAVGLVAQGQETAPRGTTGVASAPAAAAQQTAAPADRVTLSGCVERQSDAAPAAATRAASTPFALTKVAAATSTPAASSVPLAAKTFRLEAAESMVAPHVGHKVEVTGMVEDQPAADAAAQNPPRFKVESLKTVSANCQ